MRLKGTLGTILLLSPVYQKNHFIQYTVDKGATVPCVPTAKCGGKTSPQLTTQNPPIPADQTRYAQRDYQMQTHQMPAPIIEDTQHFTTPSGFFLNTVAAGMIGSNGPTKMLIDEQYTEQLGLEAGRGQPILVYGKVDGKFRATAIRVYHRYTQPIEQTAVNAWNKKWASNVGDDV